MQKRNVSWISFRFVMDPKSGSKYLTHHENQTNGTLLGKFTNNPEVDFETKLIEIIAWQLEL